jgi:tetratricopeptide (TPR) repeat protein
MAPQRFGRLIADKGTVRVQAQGFPEFQLQPNGLWDIEELNGEVPAGTRALSKRYQVRIDGAPPQLRTRGRSPWEGMSGAALLDSGELLLGVCIEDPGNIQHGRLTAVPAYLLAADEEFRRLVETHTGWTIRVEPAELAPMLAPPLSPETRSPAGLLRAGARAVRFHGRHGELAMLRNWCTSGAGTEVFLLHGPGGQGKTRLADELVRLLSAEGWAGGFLTDLGSVTRDEVAACLAGISVPTVLVVDYAETCRQGLPQLIRQVSRPAGAPVRILLLARSAGDWWDNLRADAHLEGGRVEPLRPLNPAAAFPELKLAAADLAAGLRRLPGYENFDWPGLVPDLEAGADGRSGHVLTVHTAALTALLQHGPDPKIAQDTVEGTLLDHESSYWRSNAKAAGLDLGQATLRQAVAAATLFGAANRDEALAVTRALPSLGGQTEDVRRQVAEWLGDLYPVKDPGASGWQPLEPDLLGEHLVAAEMRRSTEFLDSAAHQTSGGQKQRMFSVLANAAQHHPELDAVIEKLSAVPEFGATAVDAATRIQRPEPLLQGLKAMHRAALASMKAASGVEKNEFIASMEGLARVEHAIPQHSQLLADYAVDVARTVAGMGFTLVNILQEQGTAVPEEAWDEMADFIDRYGVRLGHAGRLDDAVAAFQQARTIYRELIPDLPDSAHQGLANSSHNLASWLDSRDQPHEALEPAQEAVSTYQWLAKDDADKYGWRLASSMDRLSWILHRLDRMDDALTASQDALVLHRDLIAAKQGKVEFLADCLSHRGILLAETNRAEEGAALAREAETIYRELARQRPDEFLGPLANTLHNLALAQRAAGQWAESLRSAREAVAIYQDLAPARPEVFERHLGHMLGLYAEALWRTGCGTAAVKPLADALIIARTRKQNDVMILVRKLVNEMSTAMPAEVLAAWKSATGEPSPGWLEISSE